MNAMFKKDRARDAAFALQVVAQCDYATIATISPTGTPYATPISPVVMDGGVYFHSATYGQRVDYLKECAAVCLTGVAGVRPIPEDFTTAYQSAVIEGSCQLVADPQEKVAVLRLICEKYAPSHMAQFEKAIAQSLKVTAIYKVTPTHIMGKEHT